MKPSADRLAAHFDWGCCPPVISGPKREEDGARKHPSPSAQLLPALGSLTSLLPQLGVFAQQVAV